MVDDTALQAFIQKENLQKAIETTIQLINKHFSEDTKTQSSLVSCDAEGLEWVSILLHVPDTMTVGQIFNAEQLLLEEWLEKLSSEEIRLISLDYDI